MSDLISFHLLITSPVWNSDEKALRVWITLLALCEKCTVRISKQALALQSRVPERDCTKAIRKLRKFQDEEGQPLVIRIHRGFKIPDADRYIDIIKQKRALSPKVTPKRRAYLKEYMKKRRDRERAEREKARQTSETIL